MPARNSRKEYLENGFYHLYNRGVEKRIIFLDEQDYSVFLSYLKEYLLPKDEFNLRERLSNPTISYKEKAELIKFLNLNNFAEEIVLLAYCLMPNHFHFLIKQRNLNSIDSFMNSICTRYTMYFNRRHKRVGHLYQGQYKAVVVTTDEQFLHLSRYIHYQVLRASRTSRTSALKGNAFQDWEQPSSFPEYLGKRKTEWIKPNEILNFFSKNESNYSLSYEAFVRQNEDFGSITKLIIED